MAKSTRVKKYWHCQEDKCRVTKDTVMVITGKWWAKTENNPMEGLPQPRYFCPKHAKGKEHREHG